MENTLKEGEDNKEMNGFLKKKGKAIKFRDIQIQPKKKVLFFNPRLFKEEFEDEVICFKAPIRKTLAHPNLKISIPQHEIVHRGLFVPDYVMYFVKLQPLNLECKRNFEDFVKLRKALLDFYPGIQMPYIEKAAWLS